MKRSKKVHSVDRARTQRDFVAVLCGERRKGITYTVVRAMVSCKRCLRSKRGEPC